MFPDKPALIRAHAAILRAAFQCDALQTRERVTLHRIFSRPRDRKRGRVLMDYLHGQLQVAQHASESLEYSRQCLLHGGSLEQQQQQQHLGTITGARGGVEGKPLLRDERLITFEVEAGVPLFPTSLTPEEAGDAFEWQVLLPPTCLAQYDIDVENDVVRVRSVLQPLPAATAAAGPAESLLLGQQ